MYKVITSFWSKSLPTQSSTSLSPNETSIDEDSWVFVSTADSPSMTNSWIASPPLIKTDESPPSDIHHFNPIENLLIEHASMSVYEQIASKTGRQRNQVDKLDEETEDDDVETVQPYSNLTSIHQRSTINLESSTCSLLAHHRHLHRLHQRRKRSKLLSSTAITNPTTTTTATTMSTTMNESKQIFNKNFDRTRLRSMKLSTPFK